MSTERPEQQRLLQEAVAREAEAHRMLLDAEDERAREPLREAAELYRRSWEAAGPRSFGRLIGMLKAAVLAGGGSSEAAYARGELGGEADSPAASWALALAALIEGDDGLARDAAAGMREGGDAFARTAEAVEALADRDRDRYAGAVRAIVADFEARDVHLTGVPIADTALVLERIAAERGIAAGLASPLLPSPEDLGTPGSYLTLAEGTPVLASDGEQLGRVEQVLAEPGADVFDGFVLGAGALGGERRFVEGAIVEEIYERGVVLKLNAAQARALPKPRQDTAGEP